MWHNNVNVKVVLLGDSGVGKSSVLLRFVDNYFKQDSSPTIGISSLKKTLHVNDTHIHFDIWDTAGQERYRSLTSMYCRDANAVILVYDITSRNSFNGLKAWYCGLKEIIKNSTIIAIAGNKEDLVEREEIPIDEAKEYANFIGAIYAKTSAKSNVGVEKIFMDIAKGLCPDINNNLVSPAKSSISLKKKPHKAKKRCC
ncbi:unnamed protein product [Blepharisma stoltei]|uniref:Uncharacterized protein n=1 Tax=Blepharisma stoltei TaxID=1481888 RepID=A0AAU9IN39_9CILI|nr:unnamed protein product [Blepharisma stoltei]